MGCSFSDTNRILVLVTKDKEQLECLPLRKQQDYNHGWGGKSLSENHVYALDKYVAYFSKEKSLDFSREQRINSTTQSNEELKKHILINVLKQK